MHGTSLGIDVRIPWKCGNRTGFPRGSVPNPVHCEPGRGGQSPLEAVCPSRPCCRHDTRQDGEDSALKHTTPLKHAACPALDGPTGAGSPEEIGKGCWVLRSHRIILPSSPHRLHDPFQTELNAYSES